MEAALSAMAGLQVEDQREGFDNSVHTSQTQVSSTVELQPAVEDTLEQESHLDELTCAICLEQIPPVDLAIVKGCEHVYCVHCILQWAQVKEVSRCPQCKNPFDYLYCHRLLDGSLSDFPVEESVVLLKRATWFEEHVRVQQNRKRLGVADVDDVAGLVAGDWAEYEDYDDLDEDEEIEQYYFSAAAGRARVVLGNRRWGENGYVQAGRMYARPVNNTSTSQVGKAGKMKGTPAGSASKNNNSNSGGASSSSSTGMAAASNSSTPNSSRAASSSNNNAASKNSAGTLGNGQGRRAKRNARRAIADADDDYEY